MTRKLMLLVGAVTIVAGQACGPNDLEADRAQQQEAVKVPTFEWDPTWPKSLPEKWAVGPMVGGVGRRP